MFCKYLASAVVLVLAPGVSAHATTGTPNRDPQAIFDAMKAASGGSQWDRIRELDFEAEMKQGAMTGHRFLRRDLDQGRTLELYDLGGTSGGDGYDGHDGWFMDEKGLVSVRESVQTKLETATDSYIARNGWFQSSTADPATKKYLGEKHEAGHLYEVVRVKPINGTAFDVWIDADSHLLNRVAEPTDTGHTQTTWYSDYRPLAGLMLPYLERTSDGSTQYDTIVRAEKIVALTSFDDKHFVMPESSVHDAHIDSGAKFAKVPFESYAGEILVKISINGGKPLPFLLDSGGLNILTPDAARRLAIVGQGMQAVDGVGESEESMKSAWVKNYRLGAVVLEDQRFLILDLPEILIDRGQREPIAGIIGYELLRRFVTRVDYDQKELTFTPVASFKYEGIGVQLPLRFDDRTPQIEARIDNVAGTFSLDTGDMGDLTVFRPFANSHDISLRGAVFGGYAGGVGGQTTLTIGHLDSLSVGPYSITRPATSFVSPKSGQFSSTILAGNIGHGILAKFVITLDYAQRQAFFEKSNTFNKIAHKGHSGIGFARPSHSQLTVTSIEPKSPGAVAGLHVGDAIVAINDVPISHMGLDDLKTTTTQPPGTSVHLRILRKSRVRQTVLTLVRNGD